jgi:hypothetical protein
LASSCSFSKASAEPGGVEAESRAALRFLIFLALSLRLPFHADVSTSPEAAAAVPSTEVAPKCFPSYELLQQQNDKKNIEMRK